MTGSSDRGQAYTLEALVAALLLVTAVLFALQAVVITPTSAGTQDRDVAAQREQVASDMLTTAANEGELSRLARFWDCSDGGFATAEGTGEWVAGEGYPSDQVPIDDFGSTLNATFEIGTRYNVELVYTDGTNQSVSRIVYQGTPGSDVVTASRTIALTDDQLVTGPGVGSQTIGECHSDSSLSAAIPDDHSSSAVYNVVEVRVVLW
ncbi:hypothetical protein GCM10028857_04890 [Salinarchaeum chitinilyticum]